MSNPPDVRTALRTLHAAAPEATAVVEARIETLESQISLHTSEDAFRAFVLSLAQQFGHTQALLQRIDTSILSELAKAEAAAKVLAEQEALSRQEKETTLRHILSQPVVLALVGILSTVMTGLMTLILNLYGAGQ